MVRCLYSTGWVLIGLAAGLTLPAAASATAPPAPGTLVAVAGTGTPGFSGDGGPATEASFDGPHIAAIDPAGNLFVSDAWNYRVRKIGADGAIHTVAGTGTNDYSGDNGPAIDAALNFPAFSAFDSSGNFYFIEPINGRLRKVAPEGTITTYAGGGSLSPEDAEGGPATEVQIQDGIAVAADAAGNVYFADHPTHRVVKVDPAGVLRIVAGTGKPGFSGDGGPALQAQLNNPTGLAVDAAGVLYIADWGNHRVRKVTPDGMITTIAGTGQPGFSGDGGPATTAKLHSPFLLAVDSAGNLFISDWLNYRIRKVTPDGVISTVAGRGRGAPSGVGGPATDAHLAGPMGLTIDAAGNVLFSDYNGGFDKSDSWHDDRILMVVGAAAPGLVGGKPFPPKP